MRWNAPRWVLLAGLWAVPGILTAFQMYLLLPLRQEHLSFSQLFLWKFLPWQLWAFATPPILYLARRFPLTRERWWKSLPVHLLANATLAVIDPAVSFLLGSFAGVEPYPDYALSEMLPAMMLKSAVLELFIYWGVIGVARTLEVQRAYRESLLKQAQMESRLVEAQLDALQMQLQPHFLFNTLNAISVLMRKGDAPGALKMLGGLSDLLRRALSKVRVQHVSLSEELDFLQRYLDIETTRFSDRLRVEVSAESAVLSAKIPNMILQPIVENAIKHGLAPRASGGSIEIRAQALDGQLSIAISDDGVGLTPNPGKHGVGLVHVEQRLAQLYPDRHRFLLEARPSGGVIATLEIPLEVEN